MNIFGFKKGIFYYLEKLSLSNNNISDKGLDYLKEGLVKKYCKELHILLLNNNNITKDGVYSVVSILREQDKMIEFSIKSNPEFDAAILTNQLTSSNINHTTNISPNNYSCHITCDFTYALSNHGSLILSRYRSSILYSINFIKQSTKSLTSFLLNDNMKIVHFALIELFHLILHSKGNLQKTIIKEFVSENKGLLAIIKLFNMNRRIIQKWCFYLFGVICKYYCKFSLDKENVKAIKNIINTHINQNGTTQTPALFLLSQIVKNKSLCHTILPYDDIGKTLQSFFTPNLGLTTYYAIQTMANIVYLNKDAQNVLQKCNYPNVGFSLLFSRDILVKIAMTKFFANISLKYSIIQKDLNDKSIIDTYKSNLFTEYDQLISTTIYAICCFIYKSSIYII